MTLTNNEDNILVFPIRVLLILAIVTLLEFKYMINFKTTKNIFCLYYFNVYLFF